MEQDKRHTIILVEDDVTFRSTINNLFPTDMFECTGQFTTVRETIGFIKQQSVDIVLLDIGLPDISGLEAIKEIRTLDPRTLIVMLTVFDDEQKVFQALRSGASGYLTKTESPAVILQKLQEVTRGGAVFSPSVAAHVLNYFRSKRFSTYRLTKAEKEILTYLKTGYSMKMIAAETSRSYHTVDSHLKNIYAKLHVNSGIQAVVLAIEEGLI
jgi:DNA-binding NarL/FixJ family response regulator